MYNPFIELVGKTIIAVDISQVADKETGTITEVALFQCSDNSSVTVTYEEMFNPDNTCEDNAADGIARLKSEIQTNIAELHTLAGA